MTHDLLIRYRGGLAPLCESFFDEEPAAKAAGFRRALVDPPYGRFAGERSARSLWLLAWNARKHTPYWARPGLPVPASGSTRLTTHSSRRLDGPANLRLFTLDDDLHLVARLPRRDLVAARLVEPLPETRALLQCIPLPKRPETKYRFPDHLRLDEDLGYLFGVYGGDGWVNTDPRHGNQIMLANTSEELVGEIRRIVRGYEENGHVHFSRSEHPHTFEGRDCYSEKHIWTSARFNTLLRQSIGTGAADKHLPPVWQRAPEAFRWGLLAGLIDTDGTACVARPRAKRGKRTAHQVHVHFHTRSARLAREVIALADSLGLTASTNTYERAARPVYQVHFTQASIGRMQEKLRLRVPQKAEALAAYVPSEAKDVHDYAPPLPKVRLKELRRAIWRRCWSKSAWRDRDGGRLYGLVADTLRPPTPERGNRSVPLLTRATAREVLDLMPAFFAESYWARWKRLLERDELRWEVVTGVEVASEPQTADPLAPGARRVLVPPGTVPLVSGSGLLVGFRADEPGASGRHP